MSDLSISPLEITRGMRRSILASIFGSWFGTCIALQFLTGLFLILGASEVQIALLSSLPMLGMALSFFSTLFIQHLHRRKPYWFWLSTIHRLLWLPIAAIPFFVGYFGSKSVIIIFLGLYFLSSILGSMSSPVWFSWMADLVPKEHAG